MDKNAMVNEQTESGKRLIEALSASGFEIRIAFWAKPTEGVRWYIYLASPFVDEKGRAEAYQFVFGILRQRADIWVDPFEVKVLGLSDSLTEAAMAEMNSRTPDSPYAARRPRPYPAMIRIDESRFGGLSIDGAFIYPPLQPAASS